MFTLLSCLAALSAPAQAGATVVISDLHIGPGRDSTGAWSPLEDFREPAVFAGFLEWLDDRGVSELVVAGDMFDLWQSTDGACTNPLVGETHPACTEAEVSARLKVALTQHQETMSALAAWADRAGHQLIILPGNHDAGLLFAEPRTMLLQALPTKREGAVRISTGGLERVASGTVLVEHGQQIGHDLNAFDQWPRPFVTVDGVQHLQLTWGENFVNRYYNTLEAQFPVIDNMDGEVDGAMYALSALGWKEGKDELKRLFDFVVHEQSWSLVGDLGTNEKPTWDLAAARALGPELYLGALAGDASARPAMTAAINALGAEGWTAEDWSQLDDASVQELCDARYARSVAERSTPGTPALCPALPGSLGEQPGALGPKSAGSLVHGHAAELKTMLIARRAALRKEQHDPRATFQGLVYGHTHSAEEPWQPMPKDVWSPWVINSGTWQRTISAAGIEALATEGRKAADVFQSLRYEELDPCYSYVWIEVRGGKATPDLRSWTRGSDGSWTSSTRSCGAP